MKVIKPSYQIENFYNLMEETIEAAGRTCWKSEDKVCEGSADPFIERLKGMNHESVLEHGAVTVRIICDRGVTHELVRHRVASFSQESTRYCNYSKGKFDSEITVIEPFFFTEDDESYQRWYQSCLESEQAYKSLLTLGRTAQEARSILPNSLKTEIVITANPREWRHIFNVRAAKAAHPQMREIMIPMLAEFKQRWPSLFNDIHQE